MFKLNGQLPPYEEIGICANTEYCLNPLQGFSINMLNLEFECDLGRGNFEATESGWKMNFFTEKDDDGELLSLTKGTVGSKQSAADCQLLTSSSTWPTAYFFFALAFCFFFFALAFCFFFFALAFDLLLFLSLN